MEKVIETEGVPVKFWLNDIEESAMEQILNLARLPFAFRHIAIMPDAHMGYGMPIGGVLATRDVVIPNAVGVDIGCGMCAVQTSLTDLNQDDIKKIMGGSKENKGGIRSKIPVGFSHHSKKQDEIWMPDQLEGFTFLDGLYDAALKQIGTLGGGNHFIEIQKGSDGHIWIMIHSGSRNVGYQVAKHYNQIAIDLNEKWFSSVPKKWELAFLPIDSDEGQAYIQAMQYCVEFALANRYLMMYRVKEAVVDVFSDTQFGEMINIAHNYAAMEHHFKTNVMVHRKGATKAYKGQLGIIPGSQGTASYIVFGLGNTESFMSCSHGAGRKMGRKQAQRELDLEAEKKRLDDLGVIHSIRNTKDLDEAAGAYKDISAVMENQKDLVQVEVKLKPLAVVKG
jgi:tRNA-splicing ligase RtcB